MNAYNPMVLVWHDDDGFRETIQWRGVDRAVDLVDLSKQPHDPAEMSASFDALAHWEPSRFLLLGHALSRPTACVVTVRKDAGEPSVVTVRNLLDRRMPDHYPSVADAPSPDATGPAREFWGDSYSIVRVPKVLTEDPPKLWLSGDTP